MQELYELSIEFNAGLKQDVVDLSFSKGELDGLPDEFLKDLAHVSFPTAYLTITGRGKLESPA